MEHTHVNCRWAGVVQWGDRWSIHRWTAGEQVWHFGFTLVPYWYEGENFQMKGRFTEASTWYHWGKCGWSPISSVKIHLNGGGMWSATKKIFRITFHHHYTCSPVVHQLTYSSPAVSRCGTMRWYEVIGEALRNPETITQVNCRWADVVQWGDRWTLKNLRAVVEGGS